MDIEELWNKAQEMTEIVRGRVKGLSTVDRTEVPYIFFSESVVNEGNTVVRRGKVIIEKPVIILPDNTPQFEGFDFEGDMDISENIVRTFFLMRGVRFPSLKYNNTMHGLELEETGLLKSVDKHRKKVEREEDVNTALILGPDDCWQFSILFYIASLVGRSARMDLRKLLEGK